MARPNGQAAEAIIAQAAVSKSAFIGGSIDSPEQQAAQRARIKEHSPIFGEGACQFTLSYRTRRTVVFLQSRNADHRDHIFYAWSVVPVSGEEFRDELIASGTSLDAMIQAVNKWEDEN